MMMKIISIIPARGGSTEIPLKNLIKLNKKPLLEYTVNASLNSSMINRTIVSTDHSKIQQMATELGAEIIKRPKRLSGNKIGIEPSISHVLDTLEKNEDYIPDLVLLLQNTSPLRNSKHIDRAIKFLIKNKYDSVFSAYLSHYLFWEKINKKYVPMNYDPLKRPNRQQMKNQFIENGAIFVTKNSSFKKTKCRISGKIGIYEMPEKLSYQIDSYDDIFIIERLLKSKK